MVTSLLNQPRQASAYASGEWKVISPFRTDVVLETCQYSYSEIDLAVQGATQEREKLKATTFDERLVLISKTLEILENEKRSILKIAAQELGRLESDLEFEWAQAMLLLTQVSKLNRANDALYEARGVAVVLGSSVWPVFYSLQYLLLNFLAGNSTIFKPSEKATLTVLKLVQCLRDHSAYFHSVQVLVGEREVGRRLACHESVSLVIFQGSFEMGMRVRQDTLSQPSKEVLLFLGAKNPSIVWSDAPPEVYETLLLDAFQGAGQDCHSISVILVEEAHFEAFSAKFHALSKEFKIGLPGESAFMGPLIDAAIMDRYFKFIGISEREGAEVLMRGKPFKHAHPGHFVTPSLALFREMTPEQLKKSVSLQTEILSPHVSIVGFKNQEELLALMKVMSHGKSASIWSSDRIRAQMLAHALEFGQVQINGSIRNRAEISFQSRKRSGNHAISGVGLLEQLRVLRSIQSSASAKEDLNSAQVVK